MVRTERRIAGRCTGATAGAVRPLFDPGRTSPVRPLSGMIAARFRRSHVRSMVGSRCSRSRTNESCTALRGRARGSPMTAAYQASCAASARLGTACRAATIASATAGGRGVALVQRIGMARDDAPPAAPAGSGVGWCCHALVRHGVRRILRLARHHRAHHMRRAASLVGLGGHLTGSRTPTFRSSPRSR
jgi:hypothetical protein